MQKIQDIIIENPYIANCKDTVFTVLLTHYFAKNRKFGITNYKYVHGLIKYPKWECNTDIFQYIPKKIRKQLKKKVCFFVFDASTEGFSPVNHFPFFDILYYNCQKYSIDPKMIIYVSGNLKDEKNIKKYAENRKVCPFNVFSFVSFERVLAVDDKKQFEEIEVQYNRAYNACKEKFDGKYLSSLSRVNRDYRALASFLLCQEEFKDKILISQDVVTSNRVKYMLETHQRSIDDEVIKNWCSQLPMVVDRDDFNINWAVNTPYHHIHDQTLFQIVNETLVDNYNNTSMFYSEKTFRPIACFQPFLIYGQKHCHKTLESLGYKLFYDLFDYSFDSEQDNLIRYEKILTTVREAVKYLDSLSAAEKINWRFKNQEILKHNFKTMIESKHTQLKLEKFLNELLSHDNHY